MTLDAAFPLAGAILSAPLTVLLIARRLHRILPLFVAYEGYTVISALACAWSAQQAPAIYLYLWMPVSYLDLILFLCVLVELGRRVHIHNRAGDSQWLITALAFPLITLLFWSLVPWPELPKSGWIWQMNLRALQTTGVLQMSGLVTVVLWSSLCRLRWPERELHIITGMGAWTLVEFTVLIVHTHGIYGRGYRWLDLLTPACCILVIVYWLHYFWLEPHAADESGKEEVASAASAGGRGGSDFSTIHRIM